MVCFLFPLVVHLSYGCIGIVEIEKDRHWPIIWKIKVFTAVSGFALKDLPTLYYIKNVCLVFEFFICILVYGI